MRPCPFCKEKYDLGLYFDPKAHLWYAMCGNCCTKGPLSLKADRAEDRWNYRGEAIADGINGDQSQPSRKEG